MISESKNRDLIINMDFQMSVSWKASLVLQLSDVPQGMFFDKSTRNLCQNARDTTEN